jgi:hypothetical protein
MTDAIRGLERVVAERGRRPEPCGNLACMRNGYCGECPPDAESGAIADAASSAGEPADTEGGA